MPSRKKQKPKKQKNKSSIKNTSKLSIEKQVTPRNKERYPALNFKRQVKTRLDQLDIDYLDQLSASEKEFLNRFLEETVIANFKHKGEKIYEDPREFYGANNARNRCQYTKAKAMGMLISTPNPTALSSLVDNADNTGTADSVEDAMIAMIDYKKSEEG